MAQASIQLRDFLTDQEIILASQLWNKMPEHSSSFVNEICEKIIKPNFPRIDKWFSEHTGRQAMPMFFAYIVEYIVGDAIRSAKF